MLNAQDLSLLICKLTWTYPWLLGWLGFMVLWKLWSIWIIFFFSEGLSEAFIGCETLFHSTFLFQIRKHMSNAICECHVMIVHEWNVCALDSLLWSFLLLKFAIFSPIHTLRAHWCSLFLLYLRRYFPLDAYPLHRISFFVLGTQKTILVQAFAHETRGFSFLC